MSTLRQTHHERICLYLLENGGEVTHAGLAEWSASSLQLGLQAFSDLAEEMVEESLLRWDGTTLSLHSEGRALGETVRARASAGEKTGEEKTGEEKTGEEKAVSPRKERKAREAVAKPAGEAAKRAPVQSALEAESGPAVGEGGREAVETVASSASGAAAARPRVTSVPPAESAASPPGDGGDRRHDHSHGHSHDHGGAEREQDLPLPSRTPKLENPPPSKPEPPPPTKTCEKPGLLRRVKRRIKKLLGR